MTQHPQKMDPRRLLYLLLALQAQQRGQGKPAGGATGGNQPSTIDQLIRTLNKGWGAYNTGSDLYNLGTQAVNYFAAPAATAATQAAWNAGAGEATQAAWNAGATAASSSGATAASGASGADSAVPDLGPWIATAMSVYNSGKAMFDENLSDEDKAYEANLAPIRAVAAYYTGGLSTLGEGFARKQWGGTMEKVDGVIKKISPFMHASKMWTSDKWKTEGNRIRGLIESGVNVPESARYRMHQLRGMRKEELINPNLAADYVGQDAKYGWTNNKFANSRNEQDLRPEDVMDSATFFEKFGNDWAGKFNIDQRRSIAQKVLDSGALREQKGTIDVTWTPELDMATTAIAQQPQQQPQQQRPSRYVLKNGALVLKNAIPRSTRINHATN